MAKNEKRFAVRPDGHLVEWHPSWDALKPGWREATAEDIEKAQAAEDRRVIDEARAQKEADEAARKVSHERGAEQKQRDAENAARMAPKHVAKPQTVHTADDKPSE